MVWRERINFRELIGDSVINLRLSMGLTLSQTPPKWTNWQIRRGVVAVTL